MSNRPKRSEDSTPLYSKNSVHITPFETIRRTNPAGNEFWSSRDFARVLGYVNYRHFQAVIEKARTACFNSGQRAVKTVMMSRYACYLVIQNPNPAFLTACFNNLQGFQHFISFRPHSVQTNTQRLPPEIAEN